MLKRAFCHCLNFDTVQNCRYVSGVTIHQTETPGHPHPDSPELVQSLREHSVQVTAQRIAVANAVASHPHATAEQITSMVREQIGSISRQAVYDTLSVLEQAGMVRRIQPIGSPARFEDRVGDNHHHIICRNCGALVDIDCAVGLAPCLTPSETHGFDIDEADVSYWGMCPSCQQS